MHELMTQVAAAGLSALSLAAGWPPLPQKDAEAVLPAQEWPQRPGQRSVRVLVCYPGGSLGGVNAGKLPFDFYEVVAALAPRAFFSNSPLHDGNFEVGGVRKVFARAGAVYALHGAASRLKLVTPDAQHDFPEPERKTAYAWLEDNLKGPSWMPMRCRDGARWARRPALIA